MQEAGCLWTIKLKNKIKTFERIKKCVFYLQNFLLGKSVGQNKQM